MTFISTFVERTTGFSMDVEQIGQGTGSGIVWDNKVGLATHLLAVRGAWARTMSSFRAVSQAFARCMPCQCKLFVQMRTADVPAFTTCIRQGHIVTNFHVIRSATSAQVAITGPDGVTKVYKANLTGVDPDKDIAVLW